MVFIKVILALARLMSGTLVAQEATVTQLMSKDLTNLPGKEGVMITVEYPAGSSTQYIATMHTRLFMCWKARS